MRGSVLRFNGLLWRIPPAELSGGGRGLARQHMHCHVFVMLNFFNFFSTFVSSCLHDLIYIFCTQQKDTVIATLMSLLFISLFLYKKFPKKNRPVLTVKLTVPCNARYLTRSSWKTRKKSATHAGYHAENNCL